MDGASLLEPSDKLVNVDTDLSDFELEDDEEFEIDEEDVSVRGAKLAALLNGDYSLSYYRKILSGDEKSLDNGGSKLKAAKDFIDKLQSLDVSKYKRDGYEVELNGINSINTELDEIEYAVKNYAGDKLSGEEAREMAILLWWETTNKGGADSDALFENYLKKGLSYKNPNAAAIRNIEVPLSRIGKLGSAGDLENYGIAYRPQVDQMFDGIEKLNKLFDSGKLSMPSNLDLDAHTLKLAGDSDEFVSIAKALGDKRSARFIKERILGMNTISSKVGNIPDRMRIEDAMQLNIRDFFNTLAFNLPLIAGTKPTFETNEPLEVLAHEFGHSIARAFDFGFGARFSRPEIKSAYRKVKKDFISEYGSTDYHEHFAEAFASYVATGKAPESWISFMRDMGVIN